MNNKKITKFTATYQKGKIKETEHIAHWFGDNDDIMRTRKFVW